MRVIAVEEAAERFCPECGYNLRGLGGGRCPECGVEVSGEYVSPIPWEHRGTIGRWKAFWRTVLMVTFRPERVGRAVGGPVDVGAAKTFRRLVVFLVAMTVVNVYSRHVGFWEDGHPTAWGFDVFRGSGFLLGPKWEFRVLWSAGATVTPVIFLGSVIAAAALSWLPVFKLRPRALDPVRRERIKAIGAYACAPLAWAPLMLVTFELVQAGSDLLAGRAVLQLLGFVAAVFVAVAGFVVIVAWWAPVRIYSKATHGGLGRMCAAAVLGLPAGLVVGATLGLLLLPLVVGFVAIVVDSLR